MRSDSHLTPSAEDLFDDYVRRRDAGQPVDFEALCRAHPVAAPSLRQHEAAREMMEQLLPGPLAARAAGEPPANNTEPDTDAGTASELFERLRAAGSRGARYQVLDEIARGGMGVVQRVLDTELRRKLAMKVALSKGAPARDATPSDSKTIGRFLEEAQITSQLDHPGIVPVHEIGIAADGSVFFTMRLVRGEDLRTVFRNVRDGVDGWSQVRALNVMLKVCEAMSYAHDHGVIHRDLKPANVMVGRFGEVYVMDWGLARVLGRPDRHDMRIQPGASASGVDTERRDAREDEPDSPIVTMDGQVLGTPAYMAPEQAKGQVDRVGRQADVYAVGAMLYHLISSEVPYVPPDTRLSSRTILARVIDGPPKPLHRFGRVAPAELMAICEKAMAREIAQRYPDMRELARDLRAYVEGRVVAAYKMGSWEETRMWVRRNRGLAASLAAGVLLLLACVVVFWVFKQRAQEMEDRATLQVDVLSTRVQLDRFRHQCSDPEFVPLEFASTFEWWQHTVDEILQGRPDVSRRTERRAGLAEFRQELARLSAIPRGSVTERLPHAKATWFPRQQELALAQARQRWYAEMLDLASRQGVEEVDTEVVRRAAQLTQKQLNEWAYWMVDPRNPQYGMECEGLYVAQRAVSLAMTQLVFEVVVWDTATGLTKRQLTQSHDTLCWALYRNGLFPRARHNYQRYEALLRAFFPEKRVDSTRAPLDDEIRRWGEDGSARSEYERVSREVADLERELQTWAAAQRDDGGDDMWRAQFGSIVKSLDALSDRAQRNQPASAPEANAGGWDQAIAAIRSHPPYAGLAITRQVDLVPLGADQRSGLWEFAHLGSGDVPVRKRDGELEITPSTGLVFVLLPRATVRVTDGDAWNEPVVVDLDAFFLSKFEMTQFQWHRLSSERRRDFEMPDPRRPAVKLSQEDCVAALFEAQAWLRLPSRAQWEYACWNGRIPRWKDMTLPTFGSEVACDLVDRTAANEFGLCGMIGNAEEWCQDGPSRCPPAAGDGLRRDRLLNARSLVGGWSDQRANADWAWSVAQDAREFKNASGLRPARRLMR